MPNETFPRGTLVIVHWLDAITHEAGWDTLDRRDMHPHKVVSVGYVLREDKLGITICGDTDPKRPGKGHVNRAITIPIGMVTGIEQLTT